MQDLTVGLVELYEVSTDAALKLVKVLVDGICSLQLYQQTPTQLGFVGK